MAKRINLDKVKLVEIAGSGLVLEVLQDDQNRVLVRVESEEGGRRIIVKAHEEDSRCIVYSLDQPTQTPRFTLVD